MNFRNLAMWAIIVLLSVGLFNLFQNPNKANISKNKVASRFPLWEQCVLVCWLGV